MNGLGRGPGPHCRHRRLLGRQHQLVEGPLLTAEAAIDRKGAGDVAVVVITEAAARIDQQQVPIAQGGRVAGVVQHAGVIAAGDDRAVGRPAGAVFEKHLVDHALHLALVEARPHHVAGQLMGQGGDARRLPQPVQLLGRLTQAQLMQQAAGRHQPQGRLAAAGGPIELVSPGLQHQGLHRRMATHPEGDPFGPLEVLRQPLGQLLAGVGDAGAELGHGPLTAPAPACPDLGRGLLRLHEQHEGGFRAVGQEQGHRLGLVEPGEIPEVAGLAEGILHIGVVAHQTGRRNHRRCSA